MAKTVSATYEAHEEARTRKPYEWYKIWIEGGSEWTYTSNDVDITYSGTIYETIPIRRSDAHWNAQLNATTLTLNVAKNVEPFDNLLAYSAENFIWVEVRKGFRDQAGADEAYVIFIGQVEEYSTSKKGEIEVLCSGFERFLEQQIPQYRTSPRCNWYLYDSNCTVTAATYTHSATLSAVSSDGQTLTSATFGGQTDGYFKYGSITWNGYSSSITAHSGNDIVLRAKIPGLTSGQVVSARAGCARDISTCNSKFNNKINFGGHVGIPEDNPVTKI